MKINIIFGPPGTGKTTTLLKILTEKLKKYRINEIAYVSFTKEGVNQGKNRAVSELNIFKKDLIYFRTLHSIAFRETHMVRDSVITKKDYRIFSDKMGMTFTGYYTEDFKHNDDMYLFFNNLHRNNPKTAKNYLYLLDESKLTYVMNNYKRFKETKNVFDYTDMIENFNKQNKNVPVKVAIIDEAQDLTTLQWEMIWIAFKDCDEIYIAGDDDQAIYEWSGADVNYFLNINANKQILNQSYRLPKSILNFSKTITKQIKVRIQKDYNGLDKEGKVTQIGNLDILDFNNGESWMLLCRNRYFLKDIEDYIRDKGLVYTKFKDPSVSPDKIKAIKLYEQVSSTMQMSYSQEIKLLRHLKKGYTLNNPWYKSFNWPMYEQKYYMNLMRNKTDIQKNNIKIETIHSVKGDEADNVVLLPNITKQVYINLKTNSDSEHRVFYVACTRTKKNLYILHLNSQYRYEFNGGLI